jgi:hypothetical protein
LFQKSDEEFKGLALQLHFAALFKQFTGVTIDFEDRKADQALGFRSRTPSRLSNLLRSASAVFGPGKKSKLEILKQPGIAL